jgi:hypothetical protein
MRISKAHAHSMTKQFRHLSSILESDLGIDAQYRHAPKHVAPGKMLETSGGVLKWYAVALRVDPSQTK